MKKKQIGESIGSISNSCTHEFSTLRISHLQDQTSIGIYNTELIAEVDSFSPRIDFQIQTLFKLFSSALKSLVKRKFLHGTSGFKFHVQQSTDSTSSDVHLVLLYPRKIKASTSKTTYLSKQTLRFFFIRHPSSITESSSSNAATTQLSSFFLFSNEILSFNPGPSLTYLT